MITLTIALDETPTEWPIGTPIKLLLQNKKSFEHSTGGVFKVQLTLKPDRKGTLQWTGDSVHYHGDGRRFIYLVWIRNSCDMFRRIKVYLDTVPGLQEKPEEGDFQVTIQGREKRDGSPACATAKLA